MNDPTYVLDANVFIEAARHYYAFDLAPRFWQALEELAAAGSVRSIDRVHKELARGKDQLADWARESFNNGFASTNQDDVIRIYGDVMKWVNSQSQFLDAAKADFAKGADGWLIAYALANGYVIVTHEALALDVKKKVPIPNVCRAFNVPLINTYDMLRRLGVRWTL